MHNLRRRLRVVLILATVMSLLGGYLLHIAADPTSGVAESGFSIAVGIALLVLVGRVPYHLSRTGRDEPSEDEIGIPDFGVTRFLRISKLAAPLYLGIRVAVAYEWLSAGWAKFQQPGWTQTGVALHSFWQRAVTVPKPPANPVITYPAYRAFIEFMLNHHWEPWIAKLVVAGELLVGLGLLFGALTGIAALGGILMNFNYVYAGSTSVNPTLIILEAVIIYGWRVSGWYGLDRFLLPLLGTPWAPGPQPGARLPMRGGPGPAVAK